MTSKINIEEFAQDVVDSWSKEKLYSYAIKQMIQNMKAMPADQLREEYEEFCEYGSCQVGRND